MSYIATAVTLPFVPAITTKIGRRKTMFLGALAYTLYILVFIRPIAELLYFVSFIGGTGTVLM